MTVWNLITNNRHNRSHQSFSANQHLKSISWRMTPLCPWLALTWLDKQLRVNTVGSCFLLGFEYSSSFPHTLSNSFHQLSISFTQKSRWCVRHRRIDHLQRNSQRKSIRMCWWYARRLLLRSFDELAFGKRNHRWICQQSQRIGHTIRAIIVCESFTRNKKILWIQINYH